MSRPTVLAGAALVALAVAFYLPVLNAGFIWDDDHYVVDNETLRSASGLTRIWFAPRALPQYYPLVHTTFWVEYHLWGLRPAGYHAVNVVLHGLAAVLLWRVLARLGVPGAWLAGAIFAVHPVHVESVAWITERKNVLSAVCGLGSLYAWIRYYTLDDSEVARRRWWWIGGAALFVAAMLAKTVAASLPVVVLILVWWKRGRVTARELTALAPLFVVGVALGLTTVWLEMHHVGAEGAEWSLSPAERVLVAGRAVCFYLAKLVWPVNLTFIYPRWRIDAGAPGQYLFPAAVVAVLAGLWLARHRLSRGPLAAAAIFVVVLSPALGFFAVYPMRYSFVADHFQYHASAAMIALATAGLARFLPDRRTLVAVGLAVVAILGTLTWRQCGMYRDAESLWVATLARNPGAWMAHNNLGELRARQGRSEEAMAHFREALRLKPDHASARSNLGVVLAMGGRLDEALPELAAAVETAPEIANLRFNLAIALAQSGRMDAAIAELQRAVRIAPQYAAAHAMLGRMLASEGRYDEAAAHLREALAAGGSDPRTLELLRELERR